MLLLVLRVDEDIVKVYNHEYIEVFLKYVIDYSLKCRWGIGEPKRYYQVLEKSELGAEYYLLLVSFFNPDEIIYSLKVEGGEDITTSKPVLKLVREWQ